jgi:GAF domain-containing protein
MEQQVLQPQLSAAHTAILRDVTQELTRTTDTPAFVRATLGRLVREFGLEFAQILQREHDRLALLDAGGAPAAASLVPGPALGAIVGQDRAVLVGPGEHPALRAELRPLVGGYAGALALVPLIARDKPRGLLLVGAGRQPLTPDDLALIELIGGALTVAVYVGWLAEAMQRRGDYYAMLADVAAQVSSSLEPAEVYRLVVDKLREYFRVEAGSLLLKDEATDELVFVITIEADKDRLFGQRLPRGAGIAGYVALSQQVYLTNDIQRDPRFLPDIADQLGFRCESLICAPMVVKGNTIGVIELFNKQGGPFTRDEADRLATVANVMGVAIENARLFEFVRQRRNRLELLVDRAKRGLPEQALVGILSEELQIEEALLNLTFNNPYIVGAPVREPHMCFGRAQLLHELLSVLHQNSLLLYGERRIGKTTILRQLELMLDRVAVAQYCFTPVYIDLEGVAEPDFFLHLIEHVAESVPQAAALPLEHRERRPYTAREFQRDMRRVINGCFGPQPDGQIRRLILLIDEADVLYDYNERTLQEFRRVFMQQYAAYFGAVFAAVHLQREWKRYESPFYNLLQEIPIAPLGRADAELLIRTPVRGNYDYEEAAIDLIYELSAGRPMRIQQICLDAINYIRARGRTRVTFEDIAYICAQLKG